MLVTHDYAHIFREQAAALSTLAQLDPAALTITEALPGKPAGHIALVVGPVEIYLPLSGLVDAVEERSRLEKDLAEVESQIQRLQTLLAGSFGEKAPPAVVQKEREKLEAYQQTAEKLKSQLIALD